MFNFKILSYKLERAKSISYFCALFSGNSLIIATIFLNKEMKSPTNYFLASLAVNDLMITVFLPPMSVINFYGLHINRKLEPCGFLTQCSD